MLWPDILEISTKYLLESLTIAYNQQNKGEIFLGSNWQIPDSYPIVRAADLRPFPCICEAVGTRIGVRDHLQAPM